MQEARSNCVNQNSHMKQNNQEETMRKSGYRIMLNRRSWIRGMDLLES